MLFFCSSPYYTYGNLKAKFLELLNLGSNTG